MEKLILSPNSHGAILFNTESLELSDVEATGSKIDYCYRVERDCEVILNGMSKPAKKGDVILKLYAIGKGEKEFVIIRNDEYSKHLDDAKKYDESKRLLKSSNCSEDACTNSCG